jgi:predicted metal-binding protein
MAIRRVGVVRESPAGKDVNMEVEEVTALEAVTRRQQVKIQQTEKTSYLLC